MSSLRRRHWLAGGHGQIRAWDAAAGPAFTRRACFPAVHHIDTTTTSKPRKHVRQQDGDTVCTEGGIRGGAQEDRFIAYMDTRTAVLPRVLYTRAREIAASMDVSAHAGVQLRSLGAGVSSLRAQSSTRTPLWPGAPVLAANTVLAAL